MIIERLFVEGGFLDGLDLTFGKGINTLIGGRGTGKTSVIELLRFSLGAPNFNELSTRRSKEHAAAILQDGQVTTICSHEGKQYTFRRTATSQTAPYAEVALPIILSQTDVESIGIQAPGRMNLIDSFLKWPSLTNRRDELISNISSLTLQMQQLKREIETFDFQLSELPATQSRLNDLSVQETAYMQYSSAAQQQQSELVQLSTRASEIQVSSDSAARTTALLADFTRKVQSVLAVPPSVEPFPIANVADPLTTVRQEVQNALAYLQAGLSQLQTASTNAHTIAQDLLQQRLPLDTRARELRVQIEGYQQGAGTLSRETSELREKANSLQSLQSVRSDRSNRLVALQAQRGQLLDSLEADSQEQFKARDEVIRALDARLAPRIRLRSIRAGQIESYAATIANALRGSGLKYNDISLQIATRLSPRELIETVERGDIDYLCSTTDVARDRAVKVIAKLRDTAVTEILATPVEDDVQLSLLDGNQYKVIDRLSTGQRCTVILPIVLEHADRAIVVDQPEDHLDNAFVTETLIRSLQSRSPYRQIILSTHNANIPVLGEADLVINLGSDGQHGFVSQIGPLNKPEIVHAITSVMEGGQEAFDKRAHFYAAHPLTGM